MSLPILPVEAIASRADAFRCPVYDCTLTAGGCSRRLAKARAGMGGDSLRLCRDCALGREVERLSGGPVELDAKDGKEEAARSRGGARRKGAKARWAGREREGGS